MSPVLHDWQPKEAAAVLPKALPGRREKDLGPKEMASPGVEVLSFILGLRIETNKTAGD